METDELQKSGYKNGQWMKLTIFILCMKGYLHTARNPQIAVLFLLIKNCIGIHV